MTTIVVGGSGKGVGKTTLICGLIAALPEFAWAAVKITSHAHTEGGTIWEEAAAGTRTDTARYLSAGARRALLISTSERGLPIDGIRDALRPNGDVIFESNRIVEFVRPDVCLGVVGGQEATMKASFTSFLHCADALVTSGDVPTSVSEIAPGKPVFRLTSFYPVTAELLAWVRGRLGLTQRV